jgi:hypothetical protein
MLSFQQFLNKVDNTYNAHPFELRYGQTIMNILYEVWQEKYIEITTDKTDYDCFYDDGTVKFTLEYLEKVWNDQNI